MGRDVFPKTLKTWIDQKLHEGDEGRAEINRHVMTVYREPLRVYFLGTSDRWLGDPEEVVEDFFAKRLARANFFGDWRQSELRLRRWLMNGFCLHLHELKRERRKNDRAQELPVDALAPVADPAHEMDRAFAAAIVREAIERAERTCKAQGLEAHWQIFLAHDLNGEPLRDLACTFGVEPGRAKDMARTGRSKFRIALRDLVARDGATPEEIDDELRLLREVLGT